ncbi:MAG: hypothetical protein WD826_05670 [Actinomycetota bacterium]
MENEFRISPAPPDADRQAILAAVEQTLRREASLARPSAWRLSGWVGQRVGITDLGRWLTPERRWSLASTFPRGGRVFNGLNGRGDAK